MANVRVAGVLAAALVVLSWIAGQAHGLEHLPVAPPESAGPSVEAERESGTESCRICLLTRLPVEPMPAPEAAILAPVLTPSVIDSELRPQPEPISLHSGRGPPLR